MKEVVSSLPEVERLGGKTNKSFAITFNRQTLVLRVPGKGTESYICRDSEGRILQQLTGTGISSDVLYFDEQAGILLTDFLRGYQPLARGDFADAAMLEKAVAVFKKVHQLELPFESSFYPAEIISKFNEIINSRNIPLPDIARVCQKTAQSLLDTINWAELAQANCHCDSLADNFMFNRQSGDLRLIDWEYAGRSYILYELADFAVDKEQQADWDNRLLELYHGQAVSEQVRLTFQRCKVLCDYLWGLWALIQYQDKQELSLYDYALYRFSRCAGNIDRELATPAY
ncbi:phosphotransferase [Thalassomonas viridans]|uniref:Phosphotransferase n=1 Tax=Thalassomonas viridans TaxID=137584 RepID=A0AAF0CE74_9GAMM|nr:choline kinase family protein [Thalassomonas viridans]WDE09256.1 phosphotransferase [Thalassomonas viridans]